MSGSSRFVKIQSQQNGFTATNNRLDFIVPASMGNINLKDCFVQLYARTTTDIAGLVPVGLKWNAEAGLKFNNVALIKNAFTSSANKGMIESTRRVDCLRENLSNLTKNTTQQISDSYIDANQFFPTQGGDKFSIFQQFTKEGSHYQEEQDNIPIEIRCGDALSFWNADGVVPMDKLGDMTLHLELNLGLVSSQYVGNDAKAYLEGNNRNLIANHTDSGAGSDWSTPSSKNVYPVLDASPYWVGMPITWNYDGNTPGQTLNTIIEAIVYNADGTVTLTTADAITLAAGETLSNQTIDMREPTTTTITFYQAELVVKQENNVSPAKEIVFNGINTYELNGNGLTNYNYTLEIEGMANAVLIMVPNVGGLRSSQTNLTNWRLYLNDYNLTDREEYALSALANEKVIKTFDAMGEPLRCLTMPNYISSATDLMDNSNPMTLLCSPLFATGGTKNLQIIVESGGLNSYIVYTSVPRRVEL